MKRLKLVTPVMLVVLRYLLLVAVIGFAIYYLISQWTGVSRAVATISWQSLVLSFIFVLLGLAAGTMSWITVLNGLGERVPILRAAQVVLVGQLGKYVPGSVWAYVLQMELGRQYSILRPRILITALYAAGIGVVSSLLWGGIALPSVISGRPELVWLFLLLPIGLICLHPRVMTWLASVVLKVFRRPPLDHQVGFRVVLAAVAWSLLSYVFYGLHLWLLVNSLVNPELSDLLLLTGAISLGFTVGLFAFIFPSGVGVREAVLVGAMVILLTVPQATAMSVVSRVLFTGADLMAAGIAALFAVLLRRRITADALRAHNEVIAERSPAVPGSRT